MADELIKNLTNGQWVLSKAEKEEIERLRSMQDRAMRQRTAASDVTRGTPEQIEQWRAANKKIMDTHPNEADRRDAELRIKHKLPPKEIHNALMREAAQHKAKDFRDRYRSNAPAGVDMTRKEYSPLVHYSADIEEAMKQNLRGQGVADRDIDSIVENIKQQMKPGQQTQTKAPVKAITRVQGSPQEIRVMREQQQVPAQTIQRKKPGQELEEVSVQEHTPKISGIYQSPYAPKGPIRQKSDKPASPMALGVGEQKLRQLIGNEQKGSVVQNKDVSHLQEPPVGSSISHAEWKSMPLEHKDLIHRSHAPKIDVSKKPEGSKLADDEWNSLPMSMKAMIHRTHK